MGYNNTNEDSFYKKYLDIGKFIEYTDEEILYEVNKDNLLTKCIARLLASYESTYKNRSFKILRLIEDNIFMDVINNRYRFRESIIDYFKSYLIDFYKELDLFSFEVKSVRDYSYIYNKHKEYISKHNILPYYDKFKEDKIDGELIGEDHFNSNYKRLILSNYFLDNSNSMYMDSICRDIKKKIIDDDKYNTPIIIFRDKLYAEALSHDKFNIFTETGDIILDSCIEDCDLFDYEYFSRLIRRSTYYSDLLLDIINPISSTSSIEERNISLGIICDNSNKLIKICNSYHNILNIVLRDFMKYLGICSLSMSCKLTSTFNKPTTYHNISEELGYLDRSSNTIYSFDSSIDSYISKVQDNLYKYNIKESQNIPILNILKYHTEEYDIIEGKETIKDLIHRNIRNNKLTSIDLYSFKDILYQVDIGKVFYPYVNGLITGFVYVYKDSTYKDIRKEIYRLYKDKYINSIRFIKIDEYMNNTKEEDTISNVDSTSTTALIDNKINDNNKIDISILEDTLKRSSTQDLIDTFKKNANIFNKVFGCLVESGRSASIVKYTEDLYKQPKSGLGSYIHTNTPYGKILFSAMFDKSDNLRDVIIILNDSLDIEFINFVSLISKLISTILQECSNYKNTYNELCRVLRSFNNYRTSQFIYESNRLIDKVYSINNICELISYVLPDLEYVYLLNKYSEPSLAISYMKYVIDEDIEDIKKEEE